MVAFGFGEVIGGFIIGIIIDKIGSKKTSVVNVIIILILINVTAYSVKSQKYDWITFLMCFLWGFQDSSLNIHTFQILGFEFISQSEPFGVLNIMQGIAAFLFQLIQSKIDTTNQRDVIIYTYCVGAFAIIAHAATFFFPYS